MPSAANIYADSQEALIVALARTGDRNAFAELVRRRQSWIRNLMRRFCNSAAQADDLAQQAFMQAWRKIGGLKKTHTFGAWLKRVAVTTCLQYLRRHDTLSAAEDWDESIAARGDDTALGMDLQEALATLPGPVRLCIVLSYHECMTHGEIADVTGIALGTVKSHIRRGTERLRALLTAYREPVEESR